MSKLSGKPLEWPWKDENGFPVDPDMPILSAGDREQMNKMFENFRPKLPLTVGSVIVMGTGGDLDGSSDEFREMFYNPEP